MRAPKASADQVKNFNDEVGKTVKSIWILFVIGVLSEALQINPQKITMSGVEFLVQNGRYIAGMLYILCLVQYIVLLISIIFGALGMYTNDNYAIRVAIYRSVPSRHIAKLSKAQIAQVKSFARALIKFNRSLGLVVVFTPFFVIVTIKIKSVFAALSLIFIGS